MNSTLIEIGKISIKWYSVLILLGVLIGGFLAIKEAKRFKISKEYMINLFFFMIPLAIIGARLYYVAFNYDYYSANPSEIYKIWEGGLAIHGGIIIGLIWIIIYSKKYKIRTLRLTDIICVGLIIGQAIGRWGNFMNSEAYGSATSLEFLKSIHLPQFIIDGMYINGTYYQPTFFYESILCLIGFLILIIFRRRKYTKIGQTTSLYLIWYGLIRFFIEGLRTDSLMFSNFKVAQIVSIIMIVIGIVMYVILNKGSKLENRYNDKELIEDVKF
ncbi:MAG: prolipoprotein diacylglyceryl transferase [Bacilli bacterium]